MEELSNKDLIMFWMRVYLGTTDKDKLKLASIGRAYRDFNRTMHGISNLQTETTYNILSSFMLDSINEVLSKDFNQNSFDNWHRLKCNDIIAKFNEVLNYSISYGQAQKWINMTLKYLLAIGPDYIDGISRNYHLFHIPLDNIIQDKLVNYGIPKLETRWSRINNYNDYINYQMLVRTKFQGRVPLLVEFQLFNQ